MPPLTYSLLKKVAARKRFSLYGLLFCRVTLVLAAAYTLLILGSRLLDWVPHWFNPLTLLTVPATAAMAALLLSQRVSMAAAARLVDEQMGTKDLFLTAALMDHAPGAYKPLVSRQAQAMAVKIQPAAVIPFDFSQRTMHTAAVLAVLVFATFIPPFDLFGHDEQRQRLTTLQQRLRKQNRNTARRVDVLSQKPLTAEISKEVRQALDDVKQTFNRMKPKQSKTNLGHLKTRQEWLGHMWRRASEKKLKESPESRIAQYFSGPNRLLTEKWEQQLKAGNAEPLKQEMNQIRHMAKQLAQMEDPLKRQQLQSQIQSRLKNLADFMGSNASSKSLDAALSQAMEQLQLSAIEGLFSEALEALDLTMSLSQLDLKSLAQSIRDLKSIEDTLEALRLAKHLNTQNQLDGEQCKECQTLADYIRLYQQMLGKANLCSACNGAGDQCSPCRGTGQSPGIGSEIGGLGIGEEEIAPDDPTAEIRFKTEKARSAITAGKLLLQWKIQEQAITDETNADYTQALKQVKQGYSEAILHEQIPPGYHNAIRQYFNTLHKDAEPAKTD